MKKSEQLRYSSELVVVVVVLLAADATDLSIIAPANLSIRTYSK